MVAGVRLHRVCGEGVGRLLRVARARSGRLRRWPWPEGTSLRQPWSAYTPLSLLSRSHLRQSWLSSSSSMSIQGPVTPDCSTRPLPRSRCLHRSGSWKSIRLNSILAPDLSVWVHQHRAYLHPLLRLQRCKRDHPRLLHVRNRHYQHPDRQREL